jgi:hypothetical protein
MSYQFTAKGKTKEAAKQAVAAEFDKMMGVQPVHSKDRAAAIANAGAVIDLLADSEALGIQVTLNGYVSWAGDGLNNASISCTATHVSV